MVAGYYRRNPAEDFASLYDAAEAQWTRRVLRAEFAETQSDAKIANRLICAAALFGASERQSYSNPEAIGWGMRRDELAKYSEDITTFLDIVSDRHTHGGDAAHPRLKQVLDLVNADPDKTPSAVARKLGSIRLLDEAAAAPSAALKLRL